LYTSEIQCPHRKIFARARLWGPLGPVDVPSAGDDMGQEEFTHINCVAVCALTVLYSSFMVPG